MLMRCMSILALLIVSMLICSSKSNVAAQPDVEKQLHKLIMSGLKYRKENNYEAAIKEFETAVKIDPNSATANACLYHLYSDMGYYEKYDYSKMLQEDSSKYESIVYISQYKEVGLHDKDNKFKKIVSKIKSGEYEEALKLLSGASKSEINVSVFHSLKGYIFMKQNKKNEAISEFNVSLKFDPFNESIYLFLAQLYKDTQKYSLIETLLIKGITVIPRSYKFNYHLGKLYFRDGKYQSAIIYCNKAIEINPKFDKAYELLGDIYFQRDDWNNAESFYLKYLKYQPNDYSTLNILGVVHWNQKNVVEAERSFKIALKINPDHFDAYNNLGYLYINQMRFIDAYKYLSKSIKINPNQPEVKKDIEKLHSVLIKLPVMVTLIILVTIFMIKSNKYIRKLRKSVT